MAREAKACAFYAASYVRGASAPAGGTLLRLKHVRVAADLRDSHDGGWRHYLARLTTAVQGEDPGPDPYGVPEHRHG